MPAHEMKTSMHPFFLTLWGLLFPALAFAADPVPVPSEIQHVTVFLRGAQVTRTAHLKLHPGTHEIKLTGLSANIRPGSIQVAGSPHYTILSVSHRTNSLNEIKNSDRINRLNARVKSLALLKKQRQAIRSVYEGERALLEANQSIKGTGAAMDVDDLMEMAHFYRKRMKEIEYKLLEIKTDIKKADQETDRLKQQLNALNNNRKKHTGEIMIRLASVLNGSADLEVRFMVRDAGWEPLYDIRTENMQLSVELTYKSKVWQNTGYDWKNVSLKLSTGSPGKNGVPPQPVPWVLRMHPVQHTGSEKKDRHPNPNHPPFYERSDTLGKQKKSTATDATYRMKENNPYSAASSTQMLATAVNTEFEIALPYTIPSDGKPYDVEIGKHKIPATYWHYAAPRYDKDVFLLGRLTGWSDFRLLPGEVQVYCQGTYVGRSYLNTRVTNDTLDVSLGRDKGIVVERLKNKDFSKPTHVGHFTKIRKGWEMVARNHKNKPVQLTVVDQIPLTQTQEIEVEMIEAKGAVYHPKTGELKWNIVLEPGASHSFRYTYSVKIPDHKTLSNFDL